MEKNNNHEEFVTFRIGDQEFCVEMVSTRELRGWTPATALPNSPEYLVGVINLRGNILPILDLAARLGLPASTQDDRHVVIVVRINDKQFGILVDAVSDIISVGPEEIRPVPNVNTKAAEEFFKQVIVLEERIICQIELEHLQPDLEDLAA
ncbi:MAG: purine-binding chemotaxis protein CheW [Gammaproteobacteria bacterium]|nr:purine-binding chemotaxis protein CheW [Gammaproteobacteria bacterium]